MSFKSVYSYSKFCHKTKHNNRYIYDDELKSFLDTLLITSKKREYKLNKGGILWRAQIGNDYRNIKQDFEEIEVPYPHPPKRMKPLEFSAIEGRANPKGIPYLYLSNDKETAMSEVRPWLGSYISVGQFKINKDLLIIQCLSENNKKGMVYLEEPDDNEREIKVWSDIDQAFSEPVNICDQISDYVPTQIIAELFKFNGYDGLIYRSSLSKGFNFVLFDIKVADLLNCLLYGVENIELKFKDENAHYFLKK